MKTLARALPAGFLLLLCANAQAAPPPAPPSGLDQLPDTGTCDSIVAGGGKVEWKVEPGCTGCTVTDAAKGADSRIETAARFRVERSTSRTGGATIRATAPAGKVFPAGTNAYTVIAYPLHDLEALPDFDESMRTYLNGQVQDVGGIYGGLGLRSGNRFLTSIHTTKPFDAIEFRMAANGNATPIAWDVIELCNNIRGETP